MSIHWYSIPKSRRPKGWRGRRALGEKWAIVLAGGEGTRMSPWITRHLGHHRPKQYCTFVGTRSLFQHTLARAARIVRPDRIVSVIGQGHGDFVRDERNAGIHGQVIEQPANRDTGPGVLIPLSHILARDPLATVLVLPSDHFIFPEELFELHALRALWLVESYPDRIVLLAANPDRPERDFGWIHAGNDIPGHGGSVDRVREVLEFKEKPPRSQAVDFYERNYLWNTMIIAFKGVGFWRLGRRILPGLFEVLDPLRRSLRRKPRAPGRHWVGPEELTALFDRIESVNLSSDLLQSAIGQTLVTQMKGVEWSDWGRPQRVMESLRRLNRPLAFPWQPPPEMEFCETCVASTAS